MSIGITRHAFQRLQERFGLTWTAGQIRKAIANGVWLEGGRVQCGHIVFVLRPRNRGNGREYQVQTVLSRR